MSNDLFVDEEELTGKPSKEDRILGAVSYVHFGFIAPFLMQKDTEFIKFHMRQGAVLYGLFLVVSLACSILLMLTGSLQMVGLTGLVLFIYTCIFVFAGYKAYLGEKHELKFLKSITNKVNEIMDGKNKKEDDNNNNL